MNERIKYALENGIATMVAMREKARGLTTENELRQVALQAGQLLAIDLHPALEIRNHTERTPEMNALREHLTGILESVEELAEEVVGIDPEAAEDSLRSGYTYAKQALIRMLEVKRTLPPPASTSSTESSTGKKLASVKNHSSPGRKKKERGEWKGAAEVFIVKELQAVKKDRTRKKITQAEIARYCDVNPGTVSKALNPKNLQCCDDLIAIWDAYENYVNDLSEVQEPRTTPDGSTNLYEKL